MTSQLESPTIPKNLASRDPLVARIPFFYGWVMLPVAMVAMVATSPGQSFAIAVFNQSFSDAFQLTEKQLTGAFGLGTLLASLTLPLFGWLMDRWGIRYAMCLAVVMLGCACLFTSWASSLVMLFFAFFLLRMFGQGALTLFAMNTIAMWFRRRLGTATGIMNVGCVLLMGQVPPLIRMLIQEFGWRWAYAILGLGVWLIMLPILIVLFRNRPEEIGQRPDGHPEHRTDRAKPNEGDSDQEVHFNLRGAVVTRSYWIMFLVQASWAMIGTGMVFNIQKIFLSRDLTTDAADRTLGWMFTCMAIMLPIGGYLVDRVRMNWVVSLAVSGMAAGVSVLVLADSTWLTSGYILFSFSQGLLIAACNTIWPRYYGLEHVGKIRGSVNSAVVAGSSLGPFMMGVMFDAYGSYTASLWIFLGILAPLAVASLLATPPAAPEPADRAAATPGSV